MVLGVVVGVVVVLCDGSSGVVVAVVDVVALGVGGGIEVVVDSGGDGGVRSGG